MTELKVICNCGQKYKFDVEPLNGQMPFAITCPICGTDGTHLANAQLAQLPPPSLSSVPVATATLPPIGTPPPIPAAANIPTPPPMAGAPRAGLQLNRPAPVPATAVAAAPPIPPPVATSRPTPAPRTAGAVPAIPKYLQDNPAIQNNSFLLGVVGAVGGAIVGIGLMVGFVLFTGLRFPLMGTVMGPLIGFGARLGYKGTDSTLGFMSAALAFIVIIPTLVLLFGIFGALLSGFVTIVVGVGMAWKIASG